LDNLLITLVKKENKRRLLAALFLICFLAELGSHAVIFASHVPIDERSISSNEQGHDDLCKYLVLCSDSRRDKQAPAFGHDPSQHNLLLDVSSQLVPRIGALDDPLIPFPTAALASRPPDPHFRPPQTS
jgi:hypothetical protein